MSFGVGVGDVISVCKLAGRVRARFVDSPHQFRAIATEVRSLSHILWDLEDVLNARSLTERHEADLQSIIEGCRNVLRDLDKVVDKYHSLDTSPKSLDGKFRRLWKKLKWEPEDITELRSRVTSNIGLLNLFNGSLINNLSQATKDGVDQLRNRQDDQERRNIEDWLSSADFAAQTSDSINRRQEGTGQWLLDSKEFQSWLDGTHKTLFCPGIPGAGKTVMTSIVIEHLLAKFEVTSETAIAYLYCSYKRQQEQKFGDLVASLLKQLLRRLPALPEDIKSLYQRYRNRGTRPDDSEILSALHSVAASRSRTFFIIDALDECTNSDGTRKRLLTEIFKCQSSTTASIFATSRFIPEITTLFQGAPSVEIRANTDDVQKYLDNHITRLPSCVLQNPALQEAVKAEIIKAVDGMFLLAQLHLDSLTDKTTPKAIRLALHQLPTGSEALDTAYKEALERVEGQKEGFRELAKRVLSWITHTRRQMTALELQYALAVENGESDLDEDNIPDPEEMISVCAGLVILDQETRVIRLVHYSTQEYFERIRLSWTPYAHIEIARTCLNYLSFSKFSTGYCDTDEEFETRLGQNPFLDYAASHWGHHTRIASEEIINKLALKFLANKPQILCSIQVLERPRYRFDQYSQDFSKKSTEIHLAAYFGLEKIIMTLLESGFSPDIRDDHGQTPLAIAAKEGHEAVVKLLIRRDDVNNNSKDDHCETPLAQAVKCGHIEVIKSLIELDDVEINSRNERGETPLSHAVYRRDVKIVKLLMKRDDIDVNSKSKFGRTPLSYAVSCEQLGMVKLLIERDDIEIDSEDDSGDTPLAQAIFRGDMNTVKLLLQRDDINLNSKNAVNRTPLAIAVFYGREEIVKLLIERDDVDVNSKGAYDSTPLDYAITRGQAGIVKLLLTRDDIETNSKDQGGRTPLVHAASNGNVEILKLLMGRDGAEVNWKDISDETPLMKAAMRGHVEVMKSLMRLEDVDINSRDLQGITPLSHAASGQVEAVKLLLERDEVDINSKDIKNHTALAHAVSYKAAGVVKLLIERDDIDVNSKDRSDETPLMSAARRGHVEIMKLLMKLDDVEINSKDIHGSTPLSHAAARGHVEAVKFLLERDDIETNSKDQGGQTPLAHAASNGNVEIVELLMGRDGVEVNSKDRTDETPLMSAAKRGYVEVMKSLMKLKDVDINSMDVHGFTPLSHAALRGHVEAVKLLMERDDIEPNSEDLTNRTALALAVLNEEADVVRVLLKRDDVKTHTKNKHGDTPLDLAVRKGSEAIVKLLRDHRSRVSPITSTPLLP